MKIKLLSLMILTFMIMGIACAADDVSYSNKTENITFEGVNFTIPEGFGQSKDYAGFKEWDQMKRPAFT